MSTSPKPVGFITGDSTGFGRDDPDVPEDADIRAMLAANVFGLARMTRAVLPCTWGHKGRACRRHRLDGRSPRKRGVEYDNATKFAVKGLSEARAKEVGPTAIARRLATQSSGGARPGDPVRGAEAIIVTVESANAPSRLARGAVALAARYPKGA